MRKEMKILLICAGGMSTGLLTKKMQEYALEKGVDLTIEAHGVNSVDRYYDSFDIIMVGPQVRFKLQEIQELTGMPVGVINPSDYGLQNCEAIFKQAEELYAQK